ncbi:hypothetical protein LMG3458_02440 [Achromobacter deleyi]|jgi:hypothetical protein|uniref:Inner membrane protein n=1 Tax=Achromobacter deleyi TaxID=1353891 RepID=A0A6S6ZYE2_9BURK|nr:MULTISPECIES: hypothetical protein [Achromobacter]RBL81742.1 hypothetical protein DDE05_42425 [Streptomyces cavourensis]CAB3697011.1 hypothetical protein LMG3458_02440 [Achromobacter deleyi]CAB3853434.1 hypothetical protein LMG3481_01886 [Achromobacter deleyi]CAB3876266.1 hypothetical protein LMG3482_03054 [Achromobacter deleyi]CAB3884085.1 hypothetical protein LMG3412_03410 [Achromobacter deleyi]
MGLKSLMWILWPSFLAAAVGSAVVFALIDPLDVAVMGYVPSGRVGFYTVSFFLLWAMAGASSALTAYLMPRVEEDEDL